MDNTDQSLVSVTFSIGCDCDLFAKAQVGGELLRCLSKRLRTLWAIDMCESHDLRTAVNQNLEGVVTFPSNSPGPSTFPQPERHRMSPMVLTARANDITYMQNIK